MNNESSKVVTLARIIIAGVLIAWLIFSASNACRNMKPPPRTPEQVMGDTLRIDQHKSQEETL